MKLFPPPLEVDENEGFSATKDIFGRKKIGDGLTQLFTMADDPIVLALDGQWGSGKTVFLKMWQGELKKLGFPVVYFDAFANDYFDDAFVPIAAEIIGLAQTKLKENQPALQDLKLKATKVAKIVMRSALKIGVKAATLGTIDAGDIEGTIADEVETAFDKHVGELLTKQDVAKSDMIAFMEALESLPRLMNLNSQSGAKPKPIVIIIDELDRCRPSYALQLLERMKHFFSVSGVHFVLGVNLAQLSNSVVATYGTGIDGRLYLQKFIQLSIQLHDRFEYDQVTTASKFLAYLLNQSSLAGKTHELVGACNTELARISKYRNFSLRTLEHIYGHIVRVAATLPTNQFRNAAIIAGLCILKVTEPPLFLKAKAGTLEIYDLYDAFALLDSSKPEYNTQGNSFERRLNDQSWFESWWRYASEKNCPESVLKSLEGAMWDFRIRDRLSLLPFCANDQVDRLHLV